MVESPVDGVLERTNQEERVSRWSDHHVVVEVEIADNKHGRFARVVFNLVSYEGNKMAICIPRGIERDGWKSIAAALVSFISIGATVAPDKVISGEKCVNQENNGSGVKSFVEIVTGKYATRNTEGSGNVDRIGINSIYNVGDLISLITSLSQKLDGVLEELSELRSVITHGRPVGCNGVLKGGNEESEVQKLKTSKHAVCNSSFVSENIDCDGCRVNKATLSELSAHEPVCMGTSCLHGAEVTCPFQNPISDLPVSSTRELSGSESSGFIENSVLSTKLEYHGKHKQMVRNQSESGSGGKTGIEIGSTSCGINESSNFKFHDNSRDIQEVESNFNLKPKVPDPSERIHDTWNGAIILIGSVSSKNGPHDGCEDSCTHEAKLNTNLEWPNLKPEDLGQHVIVNSQFEDGTVQKTGLSSKTGTDPFLGVQGNLEVNSSSLVLDKDVNSGVFNFDPNLGDHRHRDIETSILPRHGLGDNRDKKCETNPMQNISGDEDPELGPLVGYLFKIRRRRRKPHTISSCGKLLWPNRLSKRLLASGCKRDASLRKTQSSSSEA